MKFSAVVDILARLLARFASFAVSPDSLLTSAIGRTSTHQSDNYKRDLLKHQLLQAQIDTKGLTSLKPNAAQLYVHQTAMTDLLWADLSEKQAARSEQHGSYMSSYFGLPMPFHHMDQTFTLFQVAIRYETKGSEHNRYIQLITLHSE